MPLIHKLTSCWPAASFRKTLDGITNATLSLILPPICAFCDDSLDVDSVDPQLCEGCCDKLCTHSVSACTRCGAFGTRRKGEQVVCQECRGRRFAFDWTCSLGPYDGHLQSAIVQMKQEQGQSLAMAVGKLLGAKLLRILSDAGDCGGCRGQPDVAACMPKYWLKRLVTGVNSAETIMCGLGKQTGIPTAPDLLRCRRRIKKQSMLSPAQRRRNVSSAWAVNSDFDVLGKHILVVDDTMTTGATAHEVAKSLKQAGADRVSIAVVGRASKTQ